MLVACAGSQGSGKSTILKQIADRGFNVITRKTSRSILTDWDVTLSEVNNNVELAKKFQAEITQRKFADEEAAVRSNDLWFTERTHADLFTYALVAMGKDNEHSAWLNDYYQTCMKHNQHYAAVFYLKAGQFSVVSDGTRGSNIHYSRMIDITMLDITQQMIHTSKLTVIDTPDLTQRSDIIIHQSAGGLSAPMEFTQYT